jgi:hypothetical protein
VQSVSREGCVAFTLKQGLPEYEDVEAEKNRMRADARASIDKFGEKIPRGAGHWHEHIPDAKKNKNYLNGEDDAGHEKKVREQKNNAAADTLAVFV